MSKVTINLQSIQKFLAEKLRIQVSHEYDNFFRTSEAADAEELSDERQMNINRTLDHLRFIMQTSEFKLQSEPLLNDVKTLNQLENFLSIAIAEYHFRKLSLKAFDQTKDQMSDAFNTLKNGMEQGFEKIKKIFFQS